MFDTPLVLTLAITTTAHYVIAMVMSLFARHQVKYLSIAWIMGIFAVTMNISVVYLLNFKVDPMMHPVTLPLLVAACFLQSIYPLSIPMPAYLQWERMWRYASPAIVVIILNIGAWLIGIKSLDIPMRLLCVGTCLYYIINMIRLPRRQSHVESPIYIKIYSMLVGLNAMYFATITFLPYSPIQVILSTAIFTALNLYLCFRVLETMALEIPKPKIIEVEQAPEETEMEELTDNFNESNQQHFKRVEHWMQHNRDRWKDNTFGRDLLCRETGFNRHLLLQCVRSAGYYNVHEYINSYRVKEVKRMIDNGQASTLTECLTAGYGTIKTLRTSFLRQESITIDEYLNHHASNRQTRS